MTWNDSRQAVAQAKYNTFGRAATYQAPPGTGLPVNTIAIRKQVPDAQDEFSQALETVQQISMPTPQTDAALGILPEQGGVVTIAGVAYQLIGQIPGEYDNQLETKWRVAPA